MTPKVVLVRSASQKHRTGCNTSAKPSEPAEFGHRSQHRQGTGNVAISVWGGGEKLFSEITGIFGKLCYNTNVGSGYPKYPDRWLHFFAAILVGGWSH